MLHVHLRQRRDVLDARPCRLARHPPPGPASFFPLLLRSCPTRAPHRPAAPNGLGIPAMLSMVACAQLRSPVVATKLASCNRSRRVRQGCWGRMIPQARRTQVTQEHQGAGTPSAPGSSLRLRAVAALLHGAPGERRRGAVPWCAAAARSRPCRGGGPAGAAAAAGRPARKHQQSGMRQGGGGGRGGSRAARRAGQRIATRAAAKSMRSLRRFVQEWKSSSGLNTVAAPVARQRVPPRCLDRAGAWTCTIRKG